MPTVKRILLWATLIMLVALLILSVAAAFLGAEGAGALCNSPAAAVLWLLLLATLAAGFVAFPAFRRRPRAALIHLGCILVLVGSLWASDSAHRFRADHFGSTRIRRGFLRIIEQQQEQELRDRTGRTVVAKLPFALYLRDFHLYSYPGDKPPTIYISPSDRPDQPPHELAAVEGAVIDLQEYGTVTVKRLFRNARVLGEGPDRRLADVEGPGEFPAAELLITLPGRPPIQRYAFALMPGHAHPDDRLRFQYVARHPGPPKDFVSDIEVIADGQVVTRQLVEVNHPLHYGGYHFYQFGYDQVAGRYTQLQATSDSGLTAVFCGYALLVIGCILPKTPSTRPADATAQTAPPE